MSEHVKLSISANIIKTQRSRLPLRRNVGELASIGMKETDEEIIRIMIKQ